MVSFHKCFLQYGNCWTGTKDIFLICFHTQKQIEPSPLYIIPQGETFSPKYTYLILSAASTALLVVSDKYTSSKKHQSKPPKVKKKKAHVLM